jgi:hypothetical protein
VKIERVSKEIDRTKGKISEQQARLRDLEKQKTELENLEIVSAVRGMNISFADLAVLLKNTRPETSATSGQVGPKSPTPQTPVASTNLIEEAETEDDFE